MSNNGGTPEFLTDALKFGINLGLQRMERLDEILGNPQDDFRCIHIAGTNGKGSTAAYTASILAASGLKVGLYTSPFLERFSERMRIIDGREGLDRLLLDETEGEIDALSMSFDDDFNTLYNIPIQIGADVWNLRCGFMYPTYSFNVYGLWEGFDSDSTMFNRNVKDLSQVAGREYSLLYKVDVRGGNGKTVYEIGSPKMLYRKMGVDISPLPIGTYFMEYTINDVFMRPMKLKRVELYWDGKKMSVQGDTWKGKEILSVLYAHQFHVFHCNFGHHLVCQLLFVLWQKTQSDMPDGLGNSRIHLLLELKTFDDVLCSGQQHTIRGKDSCILLACHILYAPLERCCFYNLAYHFFLLLVSCLYSLTMWLMSPNRLLSGMNT